MSYLVHIGNRPRFSNREMNRNILSPKMSPACGGVVHSPQIVQLVVETCMIGLKAVATSSGALCRLGPVSAQIIDVVRKERVCFRG